ncbi:MAG: High-affinity zinc uptake system binding-protein ZnuA [Chlamydiales bacterium]|nr:High-affinity zinc uptake system binding-protein ZnuA [Chlamydiales bacterium]
MKSKFFNFLVLFLAWSSLQAHTHVLVSIAPQKFLVERVGGEFVSVDVIVPAGASSHSYEPSPRQMIAALKADIWFRLGESFEERCLPSLKNQVHIVDQREGLDLIPAGCRCCQGHDPHIWLSPRLLKQQVAQITNSLAEHDPEHKSFFEDNRDRLVSELELLDQDCARLLPLSAKKIILVSHPAFGYFCRDYGLEQLSIEMEGKEPSPRYLLDLYALAQKNQIKTVYLQQQHNPKGGKKIARGLGAETVFLDPYAENVIENLRTFATLFGQR